MPQALSARSPYSLPVLVTPPEKHDDAPSLAAYDGAERRNGERIYVPFPALVRGVDAQGRRFTAATALDDLGQSGLHVHVPERVEKGAALFVVFRLSTSCAGTHASSVAVRGTILRAEPRPNGLWGVALAITSHRFL